MDINPREWILTNQSSTVKNVGSAYYEGTLGSGAGLYVSQFDSSDNSGGLAFIKRHSNDVTSSLSYYLNINLALATSPVNETSSI